jgi:hypothetical protein
MSASHSLTGIGQFSMSVNACFLSGKTYSTVLGIIKTAHIARKNVAIISGSV